MNLQFDQTFHELLVGSYQRFVGQSLLPRGLNAEDPHDGYMQMRHLPFLRTIPRPIQSSPMETKRRSGSLNIRGTNSLRCPLVYRPKHLNARNAKDFWSV
jgi:hypothetical protein